MNDENIPLTKNQLLVKLQKAYMREIYDHIMQKTELNWKFYDTIMYKSVDENIVEDLIKEN